MADQHTLYDRYIRHRYGTHRGLVRLWLAQAEALVGRLEAFRNPDWSRVARLVFVCQGNICRSAYAGLLARNAGMPAASFGLAASTGRAADPLARHVARARGLDLEGHRATDISDFQIRDDDLLLVMEVRQARKLRGKLGLSPAQIVLLGDWATPARPHLHDPFTLSQGYFETCLGLIETAIPALEREWAGGGSLPPEPLDEHGA
jgi:protein-tyrosine phosphatase